MNKTYKTLVICTLLGLMSVLSFNVQAGNRDRSGQAGAQHLLIDPWARTSGWGSAGVAEVRGMEAIYSNVAGMAFVNKTELGFSHTQYLVGSNAGISVNSFALAQSLFKRDKQTKQKIKDYGVLGISLFSMGFGDIQITTVDQPEGGIGTFSPKLIYIGLHYAKSFNDYIHGGVSIKVVNESVANANATGVALDAGIQYLAGAFNNFKIGLTLKNIGLPMSYKGDGFAVRGTVNGTDGHEVTLEQRSAQYELPSLLALGLSYDFLIWGKEHKDLSKQEKEDMLLTRDDAEHRITLAAAFIANSFSRDQFSLGVEYGYSRYFMLRAGYLIEGGMWKESTSTTFYTGPSVGVTAGIPLVKKEKGTSRLLLDYSYRFTQKWKGNHCVGIKLEL